MVEDVELSEPLAQAESYLQRIAEFAVNHPYKLPPGASTSEQFARSVIDRGCSYLDWRVIHGPVQPTTDDRIDPSSERYRNYRGCFGYILKRIAVVSESFDQKAEISHLLEEGSRTEIASYEILFLTHLQILAEMREPGFNPQSASFMYRALRKIAAGAITSKTVRKWHPFTQGPPEPVDISQYQPGKPTLGNQTL